MKNLVKKGRRTIGFTWTDKKGQSWWAAGRPSQPGGYISFACDTEEQGRENILKHSTITL